MLQRSGTICPPAPAANLSPDHTAIACPSLPLPSPPLRPPTRAETLTPPPPHPRQQALECTQEPTQTQTDTQTETRSQTEPQTLLTPKETHPETEECTTTQSRAQSHTAPPAQQINLEISAAARAQSHTAPPSPQIKLEISSAGDVPDAEEASEDGVSQIELNVSIAVLQTPKLEPTTAQDQVSPNRLTALWAGTDISTATSVWLCSWIPAVNGE